MPPWPCPWPMVRPNYRKRDPVIKLGWARSNNTVGTLECAQYGGTTLICWRDCKHEQFARAGSNFSSAGGARRADGQRAKKAPTAGRKAAERAWAVVVVEVGPSARNWGGRKRHGGEYPPARTQTVPSACMAASGRRTIAHCSTVRRATRARKGAFGRHGSIDMRMRRARVHTAADLPSRSTFRCLPYGRRHTVRHRRGRDLRLGAAHLSSR